MTSDQELKNTVAAILYRADPEGLVPMGVPDDEYDSEAEIILDRLAEVHNVDEMAALVANVLRQQFGYGTTEEADGTKQTGVPLYPESDLDEMYSADKYRTLAADLWAAVND